MKSIIAIVMFLTAADVFSAGYEGLDAESRKSLEVAIKGMDQSTADRLVSDKIPYQFSIEEVPVLRYVGVMGSTEYFKYMLDKVDYTEADLAKLFLYGRLSQEKMNVLVPEYLSANTVYEGMPLVHYFYLNPENILFLSNKGADISALDKDGKPMAFNVGHLTSSKVDAYIDALDRIGYPYSLKAGDGTSLIHAAAKMGNPSYVKKISERGLDVMSKDPEGHSALSYLLADNLGASYSNKYFPGKTLDKNEVYFALERAVKNAQVDAVHYLVSTYGLKEFSASILAEGTHQAPVIKILIAAGADLNQSAKFGGSIYEQLIYDEDPGVLAVVQAAGYSVPDNVKEHVSIPASYEGCGKDATERFPLGKWVEADYGKTKYHFLGGHTYYFSQSFLGKVTESKGTWAQGICGFEITHDDGRIQYIPATLSDRDELVIRLPGGREKLRKDI